MKEGANECGLNTSANTNTNTNTNINTFIHSPHHGMQCYVTLLYQPCHDDVLSVDNQLIPNPGWFFRSRHRLSELYPLLRDR